MLLSVITTLLSILTHTHTHRVEEEERERERDAQTQSYQSLVNADRLTNLVEVDSLTVKNIGPSSANQWPSTAVTHCMYVHVLL